ncbi:aminoglycoside phosphotransferase family protein [Desulfitibacter alkalitolerans]|uniref:aminoglycoside phosphotransferase family protein n=1 Tax=Desulfitibacter alkalitolerans TaxID=264641 RepID=UPI000484EC8A|nr:aminoglycoside phosphotransferase family protein [Desulfitibacter alkalitolerans]
MLAEQLLSRVREYVNKSSLKQHLGIEPKEEVRVDYLAQGEYNLNYIIETDASRKFVFRVNTGSQMQLQNQIKYEFQALNLLKNSSVTPRPYYLDDSMKSLPYGILIMEFLPGEPLDYRYDLDKAAGTFAVIHGLEFSELDTNFLVKEPGPFTGIYNEASRLLDIYFRCTKASIETAELLEKIILQAEKRKSQEKMLLANSWLRVINTEVNSHNFIVNKEKETCHLIDWEKPILGEPAQDLSHFVIATTTLWKRDYVLSVEEENYFIKTYLDKLPACPQKNTFKERLEMFKFFNYLRAVSWCAMAWTEYIEPCRLLSNKDTFEKIQAYIEPQFLKKIFRNYL